MITSPRTEGLAAFCEGARARALCHPRHRVPARADVLLRSSVSSSLRVSGRRPGRAAALVDPLAARPLARTALRALRNRWTWWKVFHGRAGRTSRSSGSTDASFPNPFFDTQVARQWSRGFGVSRWLRDAWCGRSRRACARQVVRSPTGRGGAQPRRRRATAIADVHPSEGDLRIRSTAGNSKKFGGRGRRPWVEEELAVLNRPPETYIMASPRRPGWRVKTRTNSGRFLAILKGTRGISRTLCAGPRHPPQPCHHRKRGAARARLRTGSRRPAADACGVAASDAARPGRATSPNGLLAAVRAGLETPPEA